MKQGCRTSYGEKKVPYLDIFLALSGQDHMGMGKAARLCRSRHQYGLTFYARHQVHSIPANAQLVHAALNRNFINIVWLNIRVLLTFPEHNIRRLTLSSVEL
jgi:hypothetical protein